MNIRDRAGLYKELRRVLKPGGFFSFYDPYARQRRTAALPDAMAETASVSTLLTRDETIAALQSAALTLQIWDDVSEMAKGWITQQQQRMQQPAQPGSVSPALSPGFVVGPRMQPMVANLSRNILDGRICLVMGLCKAD